MDLITGFQVAGTSITDLLNSWAAFGVFSHILPFLLIFAIVFAILEKTKVLGENTAVITIVSIVVGLLALTSPNVTTFFSEILPLAGMGLVIILVALILAGLFIDWGEEKWARYIFFAIGAIIALIIILQALSIETFEIGYWMSQYGPMVWSLVLVAVVIIVVAVQAAKKGKRTPSS